MIDFKSTKKKLLSNPRVLKEYESQKHEFYIAKALIKARMKAHMTQKEVADKMHTSQAQIARLESGDHLPSMQSVQKYANATQCTIKLEISAQG